MTRRVAGSALLAGVFLVLGCEEPEEATVPRQDRTSGEDERGPAADEEGGDRTGTAGRTARAAEADLGPAASSAGLRATDSSVESPSPGTALGPAATPLGSPRAAGPSAEARRAVRLEVRDLEAASGEDGHGATVPAVRPVALDLVAESWQGRAADPVLRLGELTFRRTSYPAPGVLRFVAADRAALPAGVAVTLRFGDEPEIPVASSLEALR